MEEYIIPRNIRVKETVAYGLSGKQILYLACGASLSLLVWSVSGVPFIGVTEKVAGTVFSMAGGLSLSMYKHHEQCLDKYILNTIKHLVREKEFSGEMCANEEFSKKAPVLTIRYSL